MERTCFWRPPPPATADDDNVCLPHLLYGAAAGACVGADCPRRHLTLEAAEARALRIGRRQLASAVSLADADRLIRLFDAYGRQMDADNLGGVWSCLARQLRPMGGTQAAWVSTHEEAIARLARHHEPGGAARKRKEPLEPVGQALSEEGLGRAAEAAQGRAASSCATANS